MATIQGQVTATELARNLTSLIDYVCISGKRLVITRGNLEVARLVPPSEDGASASELRALLEHNPWSSAERTVLADDLRTIRKQACLPPSPWES
ncbi:type II toxin-antitoxin system Phd/YefM family antitoxin [Candidatus Thiosymbion oneisti]|uniref:type II toxin-antitoxin system Phd/YefM family antitoxin n=1 Tax=Candidatus Thiosymbion oneisti TaxID=589554 RepID=UPI0013FD8440|nr:type II toxin-antitoxin system Phd/YefM family antitoxin [Candidatus Thiosymbion oneisti]